MIPSKMAGNYELFFIWIIGVKSSFNPPITNCGQYDGDENGDDIHLFSDSLAYAHYARSQSDSHTQFLDSLSTNPFP